MSPSLLVLLLLLLITLVSGSKLVYREKPTESSFEFHYKLATEHDVRGDFGSFYLVVDHSEVMQDNVVFSSFNDSLLSYYVAEASSVSFPVDPLPSSLLSYSHVVVNGKYIFAVPKESEDLFVGSYPPYYEFLYVSPTRNAPPSKRIFELPPVDPKITELISAVNSDDLKGFVTYLSGEASTLTTRQAQSPGAVIASKYLGDMFTSYGFSVSFQTFKEGYSPNVIATYPGTLFPEILVLVTCHYDDRAKTLSSQTERAPGANDNGSGSGALLQIAKLIFDQQITFNYTVVLIAFSGEEQGLYGSNYAAYEYYKAGVEILAVLNGDMLAYRVSTEELQVAFAYQKSTPSLMSLLANITLRYVPELNVGKTIVCCTDHMSFYNNGYPATSYFERIGSIKDPEYHKSGDLVERKGYDINGQYPLIVKSMYAGLLTIAQYTAH